MDPPATDGPDGSSLKPVSSLLAKFENLNKGGADPSPTAAALAPRAVSPGPKPDKLRDATALGLKEPPAIPKSRPQPKEKPASSSLQIPSSSYGSNTVSPSSPNRPHLPPPLSPKPTRPPSLMVESPASPPKKAGDVPVGERPCFIHTDSIVKTSPVAGNKPFKIPSRPHTPNLDPKRSPRLPVSQPPSPPPPRRSAELRREREGRATPPPINRAEKPTMVSRSSYIADTAQVLDLKSRFEDKGRSAFSSPPSSNSSLEDGDVPPMLPTRPRPALEANGPGRSLTIPVGFDPPPVHHTVLNKRREREEGITAVRGPITPQYTGEQRPALPARPASMIAEPGPRAGASATMAPPRPPRPGINTAVQDLPLGKRAVSTPTSQMPPPPARPLGRSLTVDRGTRVTSDFRAAPPQNSAAEARMTDQNLAGSRNEAAAQATAYPDTSNMNRSKPYITKGVHEISTKYDSRIFDICGELVCTSGSLTRVWSFLDGELLMSLAMSEGMKGTAVAFKPGSDVNEEGKRIWIGTNFGELMEADIATQSIVESRPSAHSRHEIIKIYRHFNELWTLDELGTLNVWSPGEDGAPTLAAAPHQSFRVPKGHTFSLVVGDELWHATGREIRVFLPTPDGQVQFQVLLRPLVQDSAGEVTAGTLLPSDPDRIMFGHSDGKVSMYSKKDYSCVGVVSLSSYKINTIQGVAGYLWAGYNTGKISVYDMSQTPWMVKKDWVAHDNPVLKIIADRSSFYTLDRCQVISLGADNVLRAWDGLLTEDRLDSDMKEQERSYCDFEKIKALVMTWNAGASTPSSLRSSDSAFIQNLLQNSDSPDILVFGFQELVDLEDKTATAKRFLKPKKKEGSDQERMSHQYRDWRDFLMRSLDDYMAGDLYQLLHTAPLVGLFTCIFVKADLRDRISNLSSAEVKRGMGGYHGNKGAIIVRFMVDDSSLCFINCHLAAGQSQANNRHNDVAAILDSTLLPPERDPQIRMDSYVGGGDGTMVMDHELCVLNGDLNYRIDTMSRDTVVMAVKQGNLSKLLERDQLLVARRRNPGFRLRAFTELPIAFAPTYKYDVGTDNYDSSEKKRSPAWCDRLLYRGRDRIQQLDYRRHEVRVSDHRPVSGRFRFHIKRVRPKDRAMAWMECQQRWEDVREKAAMEAKLYYLTHIIGYDAATSQQLVRDRASRRDHRSPSRHRA
ncbi:DNase I-like protein [Thozetella sp. PMI_491]|nr:DNase I-like protein [Thozetella sp. PMI_491]